MQFLRLIILFIVSSCITSGREFPSKFDWVQTSKTKQDDVKLILGTPQAVGNSAGIPTWTYGYYKVKINGETLTKEVKFYWNTNGTVQSYSFSSSFPSDIASSVKTGDSAAVHTNVIKPVSRTDTGRPASDVSR